MRRVHKFVLYSLLGFVGISLLPPGLLELFQLEPGYPGLELTSVDAKNQHRALHAMMAGVGVLALWACGDLANARQLVRGLGLILAFTAIARGYSLWVDGVPGGSAQLYLVIETVLAVVFLGWPPPRRSD